MMSVPAINSVLPASGNQPSKISSNATTNSSVSPLALSMPQKISVIPPSQITTSPNKPLIGVNHSSVPLSLVYENKVVSSPSQPSTKTSSEKPKDLSPIKPTSNGVEGSENKTSQQNQQTSTTSNKNEDASSQKTDTNHTEERIPSSSSELSVPKEEQPQPQNMVQEKVEQNKEKEGQISSNDEGNEEKKINNETQSPKEEIATETKSEKAEAKLSSVTQPNKRKREPKKQEKKDEPEPEKKPRRIRSQVLPYQSPLPELTTFINKTLKEKDTPQKNNEEKLIVFYRNEFLAVRNAEGGFYLCQTLQNVYRSSHRIRIRWLSQDKEKSNEDGEIYTPDFYDLTDFECILTTVALNKMDKNMYKLPKIELERIENILKRALDAEKGVTESPSITEEHPDGIDLSLYKDESQLQKPKKAKKRALNSPARKSMTNAKKAKPSGAQTKEPTLKKAKASSKIKKEAKSLDKNKSKKKNISKNDLKSSKTMEQLKESPPNEKARVVAKVLRKFDVVPAKEVSAKKLQKAKVGKQSQDIKNQVKKLPKTVKKAKQKDSEKEESHHDRRQGKTKNTNKKNKRN